VFPSVVYSLFYVFYYFFYIDYLEKKLDFVSTSLSINFDIFQVTTRI